MKKYNPKDLYGKGEIVIHNGKAYTSLRSSMGNTPSNNSPFWVLYTDTVGTLVSKKGDTTTDAPQFSSKKTYKVGDMCKVNDCVYVARRGGSGKAPLSYPQYWQVMYESDKPLTIPKDTTPDTPIIIPKYDEPLLTKDVAIIIIDEHGHEGPEGKQGSIGLQGIQGETGEKGDPGKDGRDGAQGLVGPKGDKGDRGQQGEQGLKGDKGDRGDKGDPGKDGEVIYINHSAKLGGGSSNKFRLSSVGSGLTLISTAKPAAAELKSLIAGSGITLTPTSTGITIASSAIGGVTSVSNVDGSLTISPTTGDVIGSINTAHSNTWTAVQSIIADAISHVVFEVRSATEISGTNLLAKFGTAGGDTRFSVNMDGAAVFAGDSGGAVTFEDSFGQRYAIFDPDTYSLTIDPDGSATGDPTANCLFFGDPLNELAITHEGNNKLNFWLHGTNLVSFGTTKGVQLFTVPNAPFLYTDGSSTVLAGTTLGVTAGGTGFGSYTVGDILYANTTTTLAKLADAATGNALITGGVGIAPSYGKIGLATHVSGSLPFANLTQGSARSALIVAGNSTADFASVQGTTDQILRVTTAGTGLGFGSINLAGSGAVGSSILGTANGGTGAADLTGLFQLAGINGGQTGIGGRQNSENLILYSTASATKGDVILGLTNTMKWTEATKLLSFSQVMVPFTFDFSVGGTCTLSGALSGTSLSLSGLTTGQLVYTSGTTLTSGGSFNGTTLTVNTFGATTVSGNQTYNSGVNIVLNTTTGTKIGTATNQLIGVYNATPVAQQGATVDLGVALSNFGIRAAGTAYPITTSGAVTLGSLTSGRITFAGASGLLSDSANLTYTSGTGLLVSDNIKMTTAGNGLYIKEGTNATSGVATLTAGTVTVNTTKVTANSRIQLTIQGGTLTNVGSTYVSARTAGTSFTISSSNILDASDVAWFIVEPA